MYNWGEYLALSMLHLSISSYLSESGGEGTDLG